MKIALIGIPFLILAILIFFVLSQHDWTGQSIKGFWHSPRAAQAAPKMPGPADQGGAQPATQLASRPGDMSSPPANQTAKTDSSSANTSTQDTIKSNHSSSDPTVSKPAIIKGMVTNIWVEESRLDNIRKNNLRLLEVDVGGTDISGKLTTPNQEIVDFLEMIHSYEKAHNYTFTILAYSEINTMQIPFTPTVSANFVKDYKRLFDMNSTGRGFDGVLLDFEPVALDKRPLYLQLLKDLRPAMPKGVIAVYAGNMADSDNEYEWTPQFYRDVSNLADLTVVQGYDEGLDTAGQYKAYLQEQVRSICAAHLNSTLMFGVPTHNPKPETADNALSAFQAARNICPFGLVIFAEFTTDQTEWKTINRYIG